MFREIRRSERITEEDRKRLVLEDRRNREFLKIKPETDMTIEDCNTFWNTIFQGEEYIIRSLFFCFYWIYRKGGIF